MGELRIDRGWERVTQGCNFFRNRAQSFHMLSGIAPAGRIRDNPPAFAKRGGKIFVK